MGMLVTWYMTCLTAVIEMGVWMMFWGSDITFDLCDDGSGCGHYSSGYNNHWGAIALLLQSIKYIAFLVVVMKSTKTFSTLMRTPY
jgi:hypothetical protein